MAIVKVTDLSVATLPLHGDEVVMVDQGGVSKQTTVGEISPSMTASFLTLGPDPVLALERIFTPDPTTLIAVDNGPGNTYTLAVNPTFFTGFSNPTALVGLTPVNGSAVTAMRSDASPALDQGIAPTWIGQHQWGLPLRAPDGLVGTPGYTFTSDQDTGLYHVGANSLGIATGGALRLTIDTADITSTLPFLAPDGSAAAPAFAFAAGGTSGLYRIGAGDIGLATSGVLRWDVSTTAITSTLQRLGQAGTAGAPAYSFSGDPNTGIYSVGADDLGVSTGGTLRFDISTTGITSTLPFLGAAGAVGAPEYSFSGDTNTGIYSIGADDLGLATGGVLRLELASSGAVSVKAATAAVSFSVTGAANQNSQLIQANSTASQSFGLQVNGGTNSSDWCANFASAGGTSMVKIKGDGTILVAPPTSSSTAVTINAVSNQYGLDIETTTTAGQSFGLRMLAGTNSSDSALNIANAAGTLELFFVRGDGQVQFADGSASIPSISFGLDTNTGIYRATTDYMTFAAGGVFQGGISTNGFNIKDGTVTTPSLTFDSDTNTGIFHNAADDLGIAAGGVTAAAFGSTRCAMAQILQIVTGSVSAPGLYFIGDTNTGLYAVSADNVGITGGGILRISTGSAGTFFPGVNTTASAANAFLDNATSPANSLLRSTSSIRFKQDVQDLDPSKIDILMKLRPVTYRSKCEADDQSLRWYGFIAEEVAEIEPRLAQWTKIDGKPVPDGMQYERLTVLLTAYVQKLEARVKLLEKKVLH